MKLFALLLLPLSGCSFLDQLDFNEPQYRDPTKIYLERERVNLSRDELDRFACASGAPLYCENTVSTWDCRCL